MGAGRRLNARVLVHIPRSAACVVGVAAVLILLAGLTGSDTAHAESVIHEAAGCVLDSCPLIAQLAVVSAAVMGVRGLSQRAQVIELRWRNALINLHIERPG